MWYAAGCGVAVAALVLATVLNGAAFASHTPADKMAVAGSGLEILSTPTVGGSASETHTLLSGSIKTSSPTDLVLQVTAECALWTDIKNVKNSESSAEATVKMWIEIDGRTIPVSGDDSSEPGKVVFCNRAYKRTLSGVEDENTTIESYLATRSANAFNWITLNVGSGTHEIAVKAIVEKEVSGMGKAQALIGKRTLVVEPVKLANDVVI